MQVTLPPPNKQRTVNLKTKRECPESQVVPSERLWNAILVSYWYVWFVLMFFRSCFFVGFSKFLQSNSRLGQTFSAHLLWLIEIKFKNDTPRNSQKSEISNLFHPSIASALPGFQLGFLFLVKSATWFFFLLLVNVPLTNVSYFACVCAHYLTSLFKQCRLLLWQETFILYVVTFSMALHF